jgi:DMSO reductase anchor subunit
MAKLGFERRIFLQLTDENTPVLTPLNKTARLLAGTLGFAARVRVVVGFAGGVLLPALFLMNGAGTAGDGLAVAALICCVAGELLERYLFFTAVAPVKMPGGISA